MEDRQTLAYGFVDDVYVIIHREDRVDESDWQACVRELTYAKDASRILLVARDLMPDVGQRYDLGTLQEKRPLKLALLSDAASASRVVTALKWSGIRAATFGLADLDGVLAFLGRPTMRARLSSALGPYLDRSWVHDPSMFAGSVDRVADTFG